MSHFFTDKLLKSYSNQIHLKNKGIVIMNLTSIIYHIINPYGSLASTSTVIGTRNKRRRESDYIYGAARTPPLKQPNKKRSTIKRKKIKTITKSRIPNPLFSRTTPINTIQNPINTIQSLRMNTLSRERRINELISEKEKNIQEFIQILARHTCRSEIGERYGIHAVREGFNLNENYDIIVIANPEIKKKERFQDKINEIYGMMVVQKGECRKLPEIYAINLICANRKDISKYLLGFYLYVIKKQPNIHKPFGILELAGKYTNISGYCAYQKFGFNHNSQLIEDCFMDANKDNLPMIVDLDMFSTQDIIDIVTDKITLKKDELCYMSSDKKLQNKIAIYQNIQYTLNNLNDYVSIYKFCKNNEHYIHEMYRELGIYPDYMVRSKIEPNYILNHIDAYIDDLYAQYNP